MIRTLLVDDEPLARAGLRALMASETDIEIVGEAEDGPAAVAMILDRRPDLVLLDVQMPGLDGLDVVRRVASEHLPAVIFVSAHDRFAIDAFEVNALDYLLKPPNRDRLGVALDRARAELAAPDRPGAAALARLVDGGDSRGPQRRIVVRDGDRYLILKDDEVEWIAASENYVEIHARGRSWLHRETIKNLEGRLDPARFRRIHRSFIVNLERIREITPDGGGDFHVRLESGDRVRMSRRYRDRVLPRV